INDYNMWTVRGFIYKELYKTKESHLYNSPYRDEAASSLKKAVELDTAGKNPNKANVTQSLKYQASTYHNDIAKTLDTINYGQSLKNAEKYKGIMKFLKDPAFDEKNYDYDINLIIGSMFEKEY